MSESTRTSRAPADKRLTYQQWKRRKMLRLARNWVLFLAGCAAVVALLTGGILWLLPKVHGLLAGPKVFAASVYDGTDYVFNAADARLVLVNANLPYTAEPAAGHRRRGHRPAAGGRSCHAVSQYGCRRAGGRRQPDPCGRLSGRRHPSGRLRGPGADLPR